MVLTWGKKVSFCCKENFLTVPTKAGIVKLNQYHKDTVELVLLEFFRKHLDKYSSDATQIS